MSDARWGDPREYDARDHGDEWPRVYDPRDRDEHDPRDGLMRDLDLPRGDERELVVDHDRVYELDGEDRRPRKYARRMVSSWQPMNSATSNAVSSLFGSPLLACGASAAPRAISAVCAESVYIVLLIGSSAHLWHRTLVFDAEFNGDEPSW
jgi:hypothetical protein